MMVLGFWLFTALAAWIRGVRLGSDATKNHGSTAIQCPPTPGPGKKGDIPMYFLNRLKAEFSRDQEGLQPNDTFLQKYERLMKIYNA